MRGESIRTDLENIFTLTERLCDAYSMENTHGVDGFEAENNIGGNESSEVADHITSLDRK